MARPGQGRIVGGRRGDNRFDRLKAAGPAPAAGPSSESADGEQPFEQLEQYFGGFVLVGETPAQIAYGLQQPEIALPFRRR